MNILLVNPYHTKYPNLALMKISTFHKSKGDQVYFQEGFVDKKMDVDKIYISTLFTYKAQRTIKCIEQYRKAYPKAEMVVGGIYASLMPDHLRENAGVEPVIGLWKEVDFLPPDYKLFNEHSYGDRSYVFTTRGCRNICKFCAVRRLEPEYVENPFWKESISLDKSKVTIYDNNMATIDEQHYENVINYLKEKGLRVTFDNGFDARYLKPEHVKLLQGLKIERNGIRLAFDTMAQEGHIQRAIELFLKYQIPKSKLMTYVLYNFEDDLEDAFYRAEEVRRYGVRVYPQQYMPLDWIQEKQKYVAPKWDRKMLREFRFYWMMMGVNSKMSFKRYLEVGGECGVTGKKKIM